MGRILKCPVCHIRLSSRKLILIHIVRHHPIDDERITHETEGSAASGGPVDLLPWPIKTRRRGSNSLAMVVMQAPAINNQMNLAVAAAEPPQPQPQPQLQPPQPEEGNGMEVVLYDENKALDLPLVKKRLAFVHAVALNRYICPICGRVYTDGRALGGHKAQHTMAARKMERLRAAGEMVVHMPQRRHVGPHQCQRCGRVFSSGQGLGGHKQHCRRRAQPAPPARVVRDFDLNELPPMEEED